MADGKMVGGGEEEGECRWWWTREVKKSDVM